MTENKEKRVPKSSVKFSITLSDEQKKAKEEILKHPYNFVLGEAGSGKTLLSIQIALDKYFKREVKPYYPDAWMDRKKDKIGYEINFTQYFYKYQPPRQLEDIEADIQAVTQEILELEKEEL